MSELRHLVQSLLERRGTIAIKRLSLKVGVDLTQVLSGTLPPAPQLTRRVQTALLELGF